MDISDMFDDEGFSASKANAPAEKHLRSPILSSLLERVQKFLDAIMLENQKNKSSGGKLYIPPEAEYLVNKVQRIDTSYSYSSLPRLVRPLVKDLALVSNVPSITIPELYPELFHRTIATSKILEESWGQAAELYEHELAAFSSWAKIPEFQRFVEQERGSRRKISKVTFESFENFRYWDFVVERYRSRKLQKKFGGSPLTIHDSKFFFYDGFVMEQRGDVVPVYKDGKLIKRIPPIRRLYSYEQLQMLQDACLARFNAFLAISNKMHNASDNMEDILLRVLQWQEKTLTQYGNAGYELVKSPESVAKAYLTKLTDGDVLRSGSYERTIMKMRAKERGMSKSYKTPLTDELSDIILNTEDIWTCSEVFGCTKLSGHPFVYASKSAQSVRKEGCPQARHDIVAIRDYHRHFKHLILERYLNKHKVWPPFSETPRDGTKLRYLHDNNVCHISRGSYPLSDWDDVEFGKFMEFDYSPDYLDMIDDKAVCPGASKAAGFWFGSDSTSYRRLLESLIRREDVDTYKIVDRMRRGKFTLEERIIELTQKEREFKTSARCFCKLVFEVRIFFVLTEANLKRFMGGDSGDNGYMPQQTMTMSNAKLKKRLYDLTSNAKRDNTCLVEVDFTRWNLRWRAASVNPIARTLESIFGLRGVFSQAHYFFQSSTVCVTDKHTLPRGIKPGLPAHKWPDSDLVWRNHVGGFEGIQQTLWTICTISMMYYSLKDENCSFQMAGQGDNQVFYVTFDLHKKTLQQSLQDFLDNMERNCERLNHEVKPEECVDSTTVLTYGKEIYVSGIHVLYSLKFSSRAFARLDNSVPSLQKEIAGIVANSVAVASTLKKSFKAIWWKFIQVILLLRRRLNSPVYSSEHSGLKRLLASKTSRQSLLIPGSLGGFPMMPWTRYFSKGETDDLSFDTAATFFLSEHVPLIRSYMTTLLSGEFSPREPDPTNLINDPHSIPIDRPNDASHLVSDIVGRALPNIVVNKDLKPLVMPTLRSQGEEYKKQLVTMDPLYPEIASDLFALTPAGLYQKTVKRFSMTRTIERIVPGTDISAEVKQANCTFLKKFLDRIAQCSRIVGRAHPNPYDTAAELRSLWNLNLRNSSVGIYTPFEFELSYHNPSVPSIGAFVKNKEDLLNTKGQNPPNFGTKTMQKVSDHGYRIVNCNSTMRELKQAILMYSELQGDPSVMPFIESIVTSRSPWLPSQLIPLFPSVYGGTAVHRHAANKHKFGMLGSNSVSTNIILSSDNAGILSGGEDDYPVVFQTFYLTLTNLYQLLSACGIPVPNSMVLPIPAKLDTIDSRPVRSPPNLSVPKWPPLRGNKLAWVQEMFATEVPVIPDPKLIPRIWEIQDDRDLLYSYLESEISTKLTSYKVWDGILSPVDIFDFKEITRIDPYVVEEALVWECITEIFSEFLSYDVVDATSKKRRQTLDRITQVYAGMWVRIRLHPDFTKTDYNAKRHITLQPGTDGYKRPVSYMSSVFKRDIKEILEGKTTVSIPRLILFSNWKESTRRLAERRLTLVHVLALYPSVDIEELKQLIAASRPPLNLVQRDPATYLHASTRIVSKKIRGYLYDIPITECRFLNYSPKEAMRLVRDRDPAIQYCRHAGKQINYRTHGLVRYKRKGLSGKLQPAVTIDHPPSEDRYRVLRRRTVGITTPLFSDWYAVIFHLLSTRQRLPGPVHLFGVGRGATARCFCDLGIASIGYDLLTSFPEVAQRSTSYKPPEILYAKDSSLFRWSEHTFRYGGDVHIGDLGLPAKSEVTVVIDLDIGVNETLTVVDRLPIGTSLLLRAKGSEDDIRYAISSLNPDKVYSLTWSNSLGLIDAVLYCSRYEVLADGNYDDVILTNQSELDYTYAQPDSVMQLWNVNPRFANRLELRETDSESDLRNYLSSLLEKTNPLDWEQDIIRTMRGDVKRNELTGAELRVKAVIDTLVAMD